MKNTITKLTFLALIALAFTGCGNDSHFYSGDNSSSTQIIATNCDVDDINQYTPLQSGDIISKEQNNTVVKIFHFAQNNQKFICVESGKVSVVRMQ